MKWRYACYGRPLSRAPVAGLCALMLACGASHQGPGAALDAGTDAAADATPDAEPDAGLCDDGAPPRMLYADLDQDGFGAGEPSLACPTRDLTENATDCDDNDELVFPSDGPESDRAGACLDHLDNDCDLLVNDGCGPGTGEEVLVPEGPFTMGCSFTMGEVSCQRQELPVHTVEMSAYAIDKYEVTVSEYLDWLRTLEPRLVDGQALAEEQSLGVWALEDGTPVTYWHYDESTSPPTPVLDDGVDPNLPIATATFFGARAYCRWRGSDLPTEAMWEKAARGGLEQPDMGQRVYPWGDDPDVEAAVGGIQDDGPAVVGAYGGDTSAYGALDMGGNVGEWVSDWSSFSYYASRAILWSDPIGPSRPTRLDTINYVSSTHNFRSASWSGLPRIFSHVARRTFQSADEVSAVLQDATPARPGRWGIRCARYLPRTPPPPPTSCDGGASPAMLFADGDGDGFGAGDPSLACPAPGLVTQGGDCNDASADAFPRDTAETALSGACENALDDDCNGLRNDGCGPGSGEEVLIRAGRVRLGCLDTDADCDADESPARVVDLPAFAIDKYEVSLGEFEAWFNTFFPKADPGALVVEMQTLALYADADGAPIANWDYMWLPGRGFQVVLRPGVDPLLPVGSITEYGAAMYCREHGGALPTEAEWEKAARGGMEQADEGQRLYPMGDEIPASLLAHPSASVPVGSTPEDLSPYGVMDMAGNVTEWVRDFYWADASALPAAALWADQPFQRRYTGPTRSTRGGSYQSAAPDMRVSARRPYEENESERILRSSHQPTFGFRCVREAGSVARQPCGAEVCR